jgi:radical SAM protein with 4Fe4S-binding SPASM domain
LSKAIKCFGILLNIFSSIGNNSQALKVLVLLQKLNVLMTVHSYRKENFGYILAFANGKIGLYKKEVAKVLKKKDISEKTCQPYKLKFLTVENNFYLKSPLIVWIELTRQCNLKCKHCFVSGGKSLKNELTTDKIYDLLDQLKMLNVFCVVFSGGEPLLNQNFLSIIQYANKLNFVTSLVTNGTLLTEEIIKKLPEKNFRLTISIDGIKSHSRLRGEVKTNSLLNKLLILKKFNVSCNVSTTITAENIFELEELFLWLIKKEISFRTIPFAPLGQGAINEQLQLRNKHVDLAARLWQMEIKFEHIMRSKMGLTFSSFYDFALNLVYMTRRCKGGKSVCYITSNGTVYPCTTCVGVDLFQVGNIQHSPFKKIWNNSFTGFRNITWDDFEECNQCLFSKETYFCTNRCPPLAKKYKNNIFACAATPFDTASLKLRTGLLERMEIYNEGKP